jgi:hypothetical protein
MRALFEQSAIPASIENTGGGCTAAMFYLNTGAMFVLTDAEDPSIPDDDETPVYVGAYAHSASWNDGETVESLSGTLPNISAGIAFINANADALNAYASGIWAAGSIARTVSEQWLHCLDADVLNLPADSTVGAGVVKLCANADALMDSTCDDGGNTEPIFRSRVRSAVIDQISVWWRG